MTPFSEVKDVKVVFIGESGAGKSALLTRFFSDTFDDSTPVTIGIDFRHKVYQLQDGTSVRLQLWDTGGQERFRQLMPSYIRNAAVAVIVFDLTDHKALENIVRWAAYVDRERGNKTKLVLVGNKCDLKSDRKMSTVTISGIMKDCHACYIETSAKTGENISELFSSIACMPFPEYKKARTINLSESEKKGIRSCC